MKKKSLGDLNNFEITVMQYFANNLEQAQADTMQLFTVPSHLKPAPEKKATHNRKHAFVSTF